MLYKELKKELHQLIETECNKYIGTEFNNGSSFTYLRSQWVPISDKIKNKIQTYIKSQLVYCNLEDYAGYLNTEFFVTLKTDLIKDEEKDFLSLFRISITADVDLSYDNTAKIISFNTSIQRTILLPQDIDKVLCAPHPYLKSYLKKKFRLKDDINNLVKQFYLEMKNEYNVRYFNIVRESTQKGLDLYINHILKNDFFSTEFCTKMKHYDFLSFPSNPNDILPIYDVDSFRKQLNTLILKKRIYSVCFEIFENSEKIKEEYFQALPMSQIKYYHTHIKNLFYEDIHTPACGTALIRMTITNVFTGKLKTVDDSFYY